MILRWLLIEHPGPWPVEALSTPDLPAATRTRIATAARAVSGRVLLVRRPGRARKPIEQPRRSWCVVTADGVQWGQWATPEDLHEAADALRAPSTEPARGPLLLVCAHGVHDTCCALRGRPVAAALAARWPNAVWECSHVGGDRFAPNVVVLPDGVYYGYLDADEAVGVLERHLEGGVSARHLRGFCRYPPAAQVALGDAHRRWGPYGVDDVEVRDVRQPAADRWLIELVLPDRRLIRSTVTTSRRAPAHLTCRAAHDSSVLDYDVSVFEPAVG